MRAWISERETTLPAPPQQQLEERALAHRQPHRLAAAHDLARLGLVA